MTKKGVLGILKNYGNFRKRTPDEFYHLKQTQVKRILKTSYSILSQKSVQWNHETKNVFTGLMYIKQVIDNINSIKFGTTIFLQLLAKRYFKR